MGARVAIEIFAPGDFLKEELEARNWTQIEFAEIIGRDSRLVYEIINGKRTITPETAIAFAEALGTTPELWMNLESQYQLSKVRPTEGVVARKSFLHSKFPVREMIKRGWIQATKSIEVLEEQVLSYFNIKSVEDAPSFAHSAKKTAYTNASIEQLAWLFRVKEIASTLVVQSYSESALRGALEKLHSFMAAPEEARHVTRLLNECGVRVVFVEALAGSKIDGACFWLDSKKPVIGMSLRFDRIDNFWFVLRHEIEHVLRGDGKDGPCIDVDIDSVNSDLPQNEVVANTESANFCIPKAEMDDFYNRVFPYFSEERVCAFAVRVGVHPGVVVGQLQRRLDKHAFLRKYQVKVRSIVISGGMVDGWKTEYPLS